MKVGKLVVFEGISGTGKETQAKLLQKFLKRKHIVAHIVFHPSPELKNILFAWRKQRHISSATELYLFLADRRSRVEQIINPALARGEWIISLRSYLSAYVYQGDGKEFQKFEPKADWLFYFDITPAAARRRILKRGELIGKFETQKLLHEKRNIYKKVLRTIPHVVIDAGQTLEHIHKQIVRNITE